MALNPFFLQGSLGEQRLVQELINEQLKIYGVEVLYLPRKIVNSNTVIREVTSSKFDDNFSIEAYVKNYAGYSGSGDILTKFGMSLKDELTLVISKERFEDFIAPFLAGMDENEIIVSSRPREGDLIFFPLGKRLFEIKFVEHEQPFYQLGKTYVYELVCELFELGDEIGGFSDVNTSVGEIDSTLQNQAYITSIQLFGNGQQATATAVNISNYVRKINLINDGYGYTGITTVHLTPAPVGGINATAVAINTHSSGAYSVKEILLINPGFGYTQPPIVSIYGNGSGASAYSEIVTGSYGSGPVVIQVPGKSYVNPPQVTFSSPSIGTGVTAIGKAIVSAAGSISQILIKDSGIGYTAAPSISIAQPPLLTGIGTFTFNEVIIGQTSGTKSRIKSWDKNTNIIEVGIIDGSFILGEVIVGSASSAIYEIKSISSSKFADKYEENDEIESEADLILDFSESNPFGTY